MTGFASALLVRRGTPEWDAVLRATGILALAAIYPAIRWPDVAVLAGFVCLTVFVSGPISMVLPAAFEPMLMVAGRLYHPLLVTLLAVAGNLYMRSEEHTSELQSLTNLVCRLLLEKKKIIE